MKTALPFCVLFALALDASAALSPKYKEWREGPVQWIMSPDEQKAWKALTSDEEASRFIDLFWVRRDPTRETPRNEYRDEFMARVKAADEQLSEQRKQGSMTDRGRVFIVLGYPTTGGFDLASSTIQRGSTATGRTAGAADSLKQRTRLGDANRMKGDKDTWMWTGDDAAKFDMPQIEVVFVSDPGTGRMQRDPRRPDVMRAFPVAIRKSITNADLTEVPDWAPKGGLGEPKVVIVTEVPAASVTADTISSSASSDPSSPATRLTLLRDVFSIEPESETDPFAKFSPIGAFKPGEDLGWVAKYCSGSDEGPTVRYVLRLTGTAGNQTIERVAPAARLAPDRIKAAPGCYLMRGIIPLKGMTAGNYALELSVEDPVAKNKHVLAQEFVIE